MDDFLPFAKPSIGREEIEEVIDTLEKGWLTTGKKTEIFENEFREYIGVPVAIAISSCTAALHLALIIAGVKEGDEVITTPFTFAATGEVIAYLKAKPVFVDIDPDTYNIDPSKIEEKITLKTKVILPVHYAGLPCEMDEIMFIAKKYNLIVIEDAAHAVGAAYKGKKIGTIGDLTAFSFYATKNLATGEGGMITTNRSEFEDRLKILRLHGISKDAWKRYTVDGTWQYEILEMGYKYNFTDLQASLGIHQLRKLQSFIDVREEYARIYNELFADIPDIKLQKISDDLKHAWHLYTIEIDFSKLLITRDEFIIEMKKNNIGVSVHFIPLHGHQFYQKEYGYLIGDFPVAEKVSKNIISLPLYPAMEKRDVLKVGGIVKNLIVSNRRINEKSKVVAIVAARMNSKRMYGKPLKNINERSIIELCVERLKTCPLIDEIVIATSDKEENKVFYPLAKKLNVGFFVGDEEDVLDRFHKCALSFGADHIVRATSENPLMYVENLSELILDHVKNNSDFTYTDKLPLGCFIEIISRRALEISCKRGGPKHHSELVTLFINENQGLFKVNKKEAPLKLQRPKYRLTVDTELDLKLMKIIYDQLGANGRYIKLDEAVNFLNQNPEVVKINCELPEGEARVWK